MPFLPDPDQGERVIMTWVGLMAFLITVIVAIPFLD